MPSYISVPSNLLTLSALIKNASNEQTLYIKKDNSGNVTLSNMESVQTNSLGYEFTYPDSTKIYTIPAISSYSAIPWTYDFTGLSTLNTANLVLWIDAMETKSINATNQIVYSKTNYYLNENTTNYTFTYSANTIDLSSQGAIETATTIAQKAYWTVALVIQCTNQTLTNHTIFQHNDISIRISGPRTAPDTSSTYMIALHQNGTFKQGITFKPSDLTFKYLIYANQSGILTVAGNVAYQTHSGSYSSGSNYKIYLGQASDGTNNSYIKLHECFYYTSTTNNIGLAYSDFSTYLTSKWTLSTYTDASNIPPIPPTPRTINISGSTPSIYVDYNDFVGAPSTISYDSIQRCHFSGNYAYNTSVAGVNATAFGALRLTGANTRFYYDYLNGRSTWSTSNEDSYVIAYAMKIKNLSGVANWNFCTFRFLDGSNGLHELLTHNSTSTGGVVQYQLSGTSSYLNVGEQNSTTAVSDRWYIVIFGKDNSSSNHCEMPGNTVVRINGKSGTVTANSVIGRPAPVTQTQFFGLYEYDTWAQVDIAAFMVFPYSVNSVMTQAIMEKIEGYMAHNLFTQAPSVTGLLPNTHTYYSSAPTSF